MIVRLAAASLLTIACCAIAIPAAQTAENELQVDASDAAAHGWLVHVETSRAEPLELRIRLELADCQEVALSAVVVARSKNEEVRRPLRCVGEYATAFVRLAEHSTAVEVVLDGVPTLPRTGYGSLRVWDVPDWQSVYGRFWGAVVVWLGGLAMIGVVGLGSKHGSRSQSA